MQWRTAFLGLALCALECSGPGEAQFPAAQVMRAQSLVDRVDAARVESTVRQIVGARANEQYVPAQSWVPPMPVYRTQAAQYVIDAFTAAGYVPQVEHSTDSDLEVTNVYADLPGDTHPEQVVLVSGHLDSFFPAGADDNASSLAVVLEAARVLHGEHFARTIRFVAFDREEQGLIGSGRYLAAHGTAHVAMLINMDCVGFASDAPGSQAAPPGLALRDRGNFIAAIGTSEHVNALGRFTALGSQLSDVVPIVALVAPGNSDYPVTGDLLRSDHAHFWRLGLPALFVTDTGNFRNPNYHRMTDMPDTVNYTFLRGVARLVIGAAVAFADAD